MNPSDEYEEVESPFATPRSTPTRERLRTRKNVFNRPFATAPANAPIVVEARGKRAAHAELEDLLEERESALAETEIDYLDEEEAEETSVRVPAVRSSPAKKTSKFRKNLLPNVAWAIVGMLVLRLLCMDRGVWDYFATENTLEEKRQELRAIRGENADLRQEIVRLQTDRNYQRQLAKEHLGVIAADEFLILFAGESSDGPSDPAQL